MYIRILCQAAKTDGQKTQQTINYKRYTTNKTRLPRSSHLRAPCPITSRKIAKKLYKRPRQVFALSGQYPSDSECTNNCTNPPGLHQNQPQNYDFIGRPALKRVVLGGYAPPCLFSIRSSASLIPISATLATVNSGSQ